MLTEIHQIAVRAGEEILRFYGQEHPVDYKADDSPLTLADKAAHRVICDALRDFHPEIPIVSEESAVPEFEDRREWRRFWLVDPLDGTKEFIKQTGEFTVNIALIVDGCPQLGVIYVPAKNLSYFAEKPFGAFKQEGNNAPEPIRVRRVPGGQGTGDRGQGTGDRGQGAGNRGRQGGGSEKRSSSNVQRSTLNGKHETGDPKGERRDAEKLTAINEQPGTPGAGARPAIVASRDHAGPAVQALFERYPDAVTRSMGSSLKFCLVAEGAADLYLRDVPTMEWDTAAAQCIVESAGGVVRNLETGKPLAYNKRDIRNSAIVTIGDPEFEWNIEGKS